MPVIPTVWLAAFAAFATAAEPVEDWDCKVARGKYQVNALNGSSVSFKVEGEIVPGKLASANGRWLPAAGILFQPDDGKGGIGLQLWRTDTDVLTFGVRKPDSPPDRPSAMGQIELGQPIRFSVSLDGSGNMLIYINGKGYLMDGVELLPEHPILMCSSGNFLFSNLRTQVGK